MRERLDGIATENWIEADDLGLPQGRIGRGLKNNLAGVFGFVEKEKASGHRSIPHKFREILQMLGWGLRVRLMSR